MTIGVEWVTRHDGNSSLWVMQSRKLWRLIPHQIETCKTNNHESYLCSGTVGHINAEICVHLQSLKYIDIFAYLYYFWTSAPPHCCLISSPRRCFFILFYLDLWKVATSVWRLTSGAKSHLQKIQRCWVDSCWSSRSRVHRDRIHRNAQNGKWCEP